MKFKLTVFFHNGNWEEYDLNDPSEIQLGEGFFHIAPSASRYETHSINADCVERVIVQEVPVH